MPPRTWRLMISSARNWPASPAWTSCGVDPLAVVAGEDAAEQRRGCRRRSAARRGTRNGCGEQQLELVGLVDLAVEAAEVLLGVVGPAGAGRWATPNSDQRRAGARGAGRARIGGHQMSTLTMRKMMTMPMATDAAAPPSQTGPSPANIGSR